MPRRHPLLGDCAVPHLTQLFFSYEQDDLHSIKVFDPSIKGATDRFAYRFVKR